MIDTIVHYLFAKNLQYRHAGQKVVKNPKAKLAKMWEDDFGRANLEEIELRVFREVNTYGEWRGEFFF